MVHFHQGIHKNAIIVRSMGENIDNASHAGGVVTGFLAAVNLCIALKSIRTRICIENNETKGVEK